MEDQTDAAVVSGGDLLHHSKVKREAGKKSKTKKGRRKRKGQKNLGGRRRGNDFREKRKGKRNGKKIKGKGGEKRKERIWKGRKQKVNRQSRRKVIQNPKQSINYEECATKMKEFASIMKKASNLVRQSKRITSFIKINENKKKKVSAKALT